jgi:hypothetical protein
MRSSAHPRIHGVRFGQFPDPWNANEDPAHAANGPTYLGPNNSPVAAAYRRAADRSAGRPRHGGRRLAVGATTPLITRVLIAIASSDICHYLGFTRKHPPPPGIP